MRIHKVFFPWLAIAAFGVVGVAASGCHADAKAKFGGEQPPPPPPPAPPPPATVAEAPPPPPPPPEKKVIALKGVKMKSPTQIDMPGDIEFQTASSKIVMNAGSTKVLTQLSQIMKDNPEVTKLSIEGNTDNQGENKGFDNVKLSQQRAQSVVEWLTKNGVQAARLTAVGQGSHHPLAANDTPEHMAENRRVEFHVREFNGQAVSSEESSGAGATATGAAGAASGASMTTPATPQAGTTTTTTTTTTAAAPSASLTDAKKAPKKK
jgi:outer membrane protein OmpA-like peptidoglycan-associated protein